MVSVASLVAFCLTALAADPTGSTGGGRRTILFDFSWKFHKSEVTNACQTDIDDRDWQPVDLPHDWSIEGPFDEKNSASFAYLAGGVGWYRKDFKVSSADRGKKLFVQFDGVYENSQVWLNGVLLGEHGYGFTGFEYDLTPGTKFGATNTIAVRAENLKQPNCRWYSGSGIYRHVWLTVSDPLHVAHWGTYVTTPKADADESVVRVRTRLQNDSDAAKDFSLETCIRNGTNQVAIASSATSIAGRATKEVTQEFIIAKPKLWSPGHPDLYKAASRVVVDGGVVDQFTTPFGIRSIVFDKDRGFVLNGKSVKMKGVCLHDDGGATGAAVPVGVWERRLKTIKEIGCNAIRCSHNPPAPEFLDLCDRMGFLVIDEVFDKWEGKDAAHFKKDWRQDLLSTLERDRNHPSIVLWSVGNENGGAWPPAYFEIYRQLADTVHAQEPTRPVTAALRPFAPPTDNPTKEALLGQLVPMVSAEDVACLNYQEQLYPDLRYANTNLVLIASESYMYYRGEGIEYKSTNDSNPWFDVASNNFVAGQFLWAGIDYLGGGSVGWPAKGWGASLLDTAGFRKDRSYWHQSVWSDEPMVYVAVFDDQMEDYPQKKLWDWPKIRADWTFPGREKQHLKLATYSNCGTVELFVNGKSLGIKRPADFKNGTATWDAIYEPGELKAIGRNGGKPVAARVLRTAGPAAKIVLLPDSEQFVADGQSVLQIEACIHDPAGTLVPDAALPLTLTLQGPGKLIGLDNGDLRSNESFKGVTRTTYRGKCLAIVQSTLTSGLVKVDVSTPGLPKASVCLKSIK
jgi:beta-galactosidase